MCYYDERKTHSFKLYEKKKIGYKLKVISVARADIRSRSSHTWLCFIWRVDVCAGNTAGHVSLIFNRLLYGIYIYVSYMCSVSDQSSCRQNLRQASLPPA